MANTRLFVDLESGDVDDNPLTVGATTLTSAELASLPIVGSGDTIELVLDPLGAGNGPELVTVTGHAASATTATITRGQHGTSAAEHAQNTPWAAVVVAADFERLDTIEADNWVTRDRILDGEVIDSKIDTVAATKITGTLSNDTTGNAATATNATLASEASTVTVASSSNSSAQVAIIDSTTSPQAIKYDPSLDWDGSANRLTLPNLTATTGILIGSGDDGLVPVTGQYGSVQTVGSGAGSYEGYSINGHAVFMALSSTGALGIYDDTNNHWVLRHNRNADTELYYDGVVKLDTKSDGVLISGELEASSLDINGNADISGNLSGVDTLTVQVISLTNELICTTNGSSADVAIGLGNQQTSGLYYDPTGNDEVRLSVLNNDAGKWEQSGWHGGQFIEGSGNPTTELFNYHYHDTSRREYKTNIRDLDDAAARADLMAIRIREFNYRPEHLAGDELAALATHRGIIAQEIDESLPHMTVRTILNPETGQQIDRASEVSWDEKDPANLARWEAINWKQRDVIATTVRVVQAHEAELAELRSKLDELVAG